MVKIVTSKAISNIARISRAVFSSRSKTMRVLATILRLISLSFWKVGTRIGNNVTLRFGDAIAREVTIEDDFFIAPNVVTIYSRNTREKFGGAILGKGSHVGTAAVIGPGVKLFLIL